MTHPDLHRGSRAVWCGAAMGLVAACLGNAVRAEALLGEPFGVAAVRVPLSDPFGDALWETGGWQLSEPGGRVHYPVFVVGRLRQLLGEWAGGAPAKPRDVEVLFLFRGTGPLEVTVFTPAAQRVRLVPRREARRAYNRLCSRWWRAYQAAARERIERQEYPPLVDIYLTSMLAARLQVPLPLRGGAAEETGEPWQRTLEMVLGGERLRRATLRTRIQAPALPAEAADQPLPPDVAWTPHAVAETAPDVDIEPIAMHVPEDCFYVRCGSFSNYLWFSGLLGEYGGDLGRMIAPRAHAPRLHERMQRQLAVRESALAELLGDRVTADVAILGRDTFLREGAAIGVLLQARNRLALSADIQRQRAEAWAADKANGATLKTVTIAGRDVSLLSTPDHRLRSFFAVDGDWHLVTTSRAIVERFFAAGSGQGALGASAEFRHARAIMPQHRQDTVFAYFSTAFFRGLLGPQYQIELRRRRGAVADLELLQLARRAAANEGVSAGTIGDLVTAGFLPRGFGQRPDGSAPILEPHRALDSLRGARGFFLPVPDVPLRGATRSEVDWYNAGAAYYAAHWRQLDPLMLGVRHQDLGGGRERIVLDASLSPLAEEKYGWILSLLGPPTRRRVTGSPEPIISLQAFVTGGALSPLVPPHHLFVGVEDSPAAGDVPPSGVGQWLRILQQTPGYLGAWPKPGFLDRLPDVLAGEPDSEGFKLLPLLGLWRWQGGDFSLLSFQRPTLARVAPGLRVEETENSSQVRIHVGNLADSQIAGWINGLSYQRALQASQGNVRLLHALSLQLGVPREKALETANELLDTRLVCPLGGDYQLGEQGSGLAAWRSTRWPTDAGRRAPGDYQAPALRWWRGFDLELTRLGDRLEVHAQFELQRTRRGTPSDHSPRNLFGKQTGTGPEENKPRAKE